MLDRCKRIVLSLLSGCLVVTSVVVNADGRVFVMDLRNSSGLQGFRDAQRACASRHSRLASSEELRYAVVECHFSPCTRGWLYGGAVGTTVCNIVGSALKAVDVRTENATEDATHMDAFCIKDKGVPCGDPPSFPNARLKGHSGYEMGDELLYTCVPGYVMPSGRSAFSLLCDSCGEWYGLVEICVKDETESHVDYEDKFTDSYGEAERHNERPQEAHGEVYEEVHGAAYPEGKTSQEQQETSFSVDMKEEHKDQHGEHDVEGKVIGRESEGAVEGGEKDDERAVEDFIGYTSWEQERREVVTTEAAAATEPPVSLLSQKHLFWFPSEAFQEEGQPVSNNPVTQTTQRASGAQSEESKEHESQERPQRPVDVDDHDHEPDSYDDHDTGDQDDHDDSHHDDQDDRDSHQEEDDHVKHYPPAQHDDLDKRDRHENHDDRDDHYDMGEHEDDRDHVRYGIQEYDDRDDTYDEHESYEDHDDVTDDVRGREHPDGSEEHPDHDDHDDGEEHYDQEEDDNSQYTDRDDHKHDDHDSYDDHDSHEDVDDGHRHAIFSIITGERQNVTHKAGGGKVTTDETWLDGYPVVQEETENGDSTTERVRPLDRDREADVRTTDRPSEVEIRRSVAYTSLPEVPKSPTTEPALEQGGVEEMWPGFLPTAAPSPDRSDPSDFPSYSDTLDFDTQQAAPTQSWLGDLTEHPFLDHHHVYEGDTFTGATEDHNLPGETGERGEMEGDMGETICAGENCPPRPPSSSSRGPVVAAIIVVMCAVAASVIVGVWCYRRQQQKSSMYEMNGKGQIQTRQGQQIEMQQKV
ncbi:sushi domain-containing protein 5 isoform X2 [Micropterus salmoides]|uniref:sushi domain-containing protein 5 isoform X2 n=1 Tax=Micropterus salmoides TaxID=27706 RepID=UPI0018EE1242|nr:sushi domain-containing protein 5 isoform X2 [Micropterus salmoides]